MSSTAPSPENYVASRGDDAAFSSGRPLSASASKILLRSSWQTVNIGDMAHTFGALRLLERFAPGAELFLWPCDLGDGVGERILHHFPSVSIVNGTLDGEGNPDSRELERAFEDCDVLVHGSGPSVVVPGDCLGWGNQTGKPFGFFGITCDPLVCGGSPDWEGATLQSVRDELDCGQIGSLPENHLEALVRASFVFCRDSLSIRVLETLAVPMGGVRPELGPDAVFAVDSADEDRAQCWLEENDLADGGFLCVVPRLRWTPYWKIHPESSDTVAEAMACKRDAINRKTVDEDHQVLRELIVRWVKSTGKKAVICPEMDYQVALGRGQILDRLPPEIASNVVWRDKFWIFDEAAAVYSRAAAVVSLENHSPILALGVRTPAIYLRQPTDTIKGQMWHDFGLRRWTTEIGETDPAEVSNLLEEFAARTPSVELELTSATSKIADLQARMVHRILEIVARPSMHRTATITR